MEHVLSSHGSGKVEAGSDRADCKAVSQCNIGPYRAFIPELLKKPLKTSKAFVDDSKVSDHHAIIPTEEYVQLDHMSNEERKIYDLVVRRFISVLYPAFEYEQTTMRAEAADQIFTAKGTKKDSAFLQDIQTYTRELIDEIKSSDGTFRHDNLTNTKCPRCGKRMLSVKGKNARLLVCQDRECGYRETIARLSNARCPNCHKKMELIKKGEEETFVCSCGYKEKLSAFKARREKEGAGVSKKDVQKYLKKQKEEPVNNAFAAALSGIKLD